MKKYKVFIVLLFAFGNIFSQNIGIQTLSPDASSILDIKSDQQGLRVPRMTEVERIAVTSPAEGLTVYQTDGKDGVYYYDGNTWRYIGNTENNPWQKNTSNSSVNTSFLSDNIGIGTSSPTCKTDIRGYAGAENIFTVIPLWKGTTYRINNNGASDVPNCETALIPSLFESAGNLQVKMIIRATARYGNNYFQLRVHNGTSETYPIIASDTWTWGYTGGGETVTSPWKDWNAGTTPYEIHLNAWSENSGDYVDINAVYLVIKPKQP